VNAVLPGEPRVARDNGDVKIGFKLYASLTDYLPPEARHGNRVDLEVPAGSTIADVIAPYGLPMKLVHLVLVNGHYIAPADRATHTFQEGDVLAIWPPIAGG
jgi:sulfur carrier protein ThiS